jgi:hypothetical protein
MHWGREQSTAHPIFIGELSAPHEGIISCPVAQRARAAGINTFMGST